MRRKVDNKFIAAVLFIMLISVMLNYTAYAKHLMSNGYSGYTVIIYVSDSGKPVVGAAVSMLGKDVYTDSDGKAVFNDVQSNYIASYTVKKDGYLMNSDQLYLDYSNSLVTRTIELTKISTGRSVTFSLIDSMTKKPVVGAIISVNNTSMKTDNMGKAELTEAVINTELNYNVKAQGYDAVQGNTVVNDNAMTVSIALAPLNVTSDSAIKVDKNTKNSDGLDSSFNILTGYIRYGDISKNMSSNIDNYLKSINEKQEIKVNMKNTIRDELILRLNKEMTLYADRTGKISTDSLQIAIKLVSQKSLLSKTLKKYNIDSSGDRKSVV